MLSIFIVLRRLLEKLGLWKTPRQLEIEKLEKNIKEYEVQCSLRERDLNNLIREVQQLQDEIQVLEKQRLTEMGQLRAIINSKIKRAFNSLNRTQNRQELIFTNFNTLETAIDKSKELILALNNAKVDEIEDLTDALKDIYAELQLQERAIRDLDSTGPIRNPMPSMMSGSSMAGETESPSMHSYANDDDDIEAMLKGFHKGEIPHDTKTAEVE